MQPTLCSQTVGDLEAQIGRAVTHFEKEFMGRGPLETRTWLIDDMILIRLKGVLTPAERKLSQSKREQSAALIKQVRSELLSSGRPLLETVIYDIVGIPIQSIHTDISTKTGEQIILITLQCPVRSSLATSGHPADDHPPARLNSSAVDAGSLASHDRANPW
jgi:uncharacterized protein YbcI